MNGFSNSRRDKFVESIIETSFDHTDDEITKMCKFNFAYFCIQDASQNFSDWNKDQLSKLLTHLKDYSQQPLKYWKSLPIKGGQPVLSIYKTFPKKSDFEHPKHVPHQAHWGRFRLGSAVRLVGFVIPNEYKEKIHATTKELFDCNTFYVVFLDANHRFYKMEAK